MSSNNNIIGKKYGKLTVLEPTDKHDGTNRIWRLQCECGNIVECSTRHLSDKSACAACNPKWSSLRKDYSGQRFGRLVALECTGKHKGKELVWRLQCDCGNTVELSVSRFISGNVKSCGCLKKDNSKRNNPNYEELTGKVFGMLTIEGLDESASKGKSVKWNCRCSCGQSIVATTLQLTDGLVRSCGCKDARRYCVYKLVSPDEKVYVGTVAIVPRRRWFQIQSYNNQSALLHGIDTFGGSRTFRKAFRRYYYTQDGLWKEYSGPVPLEETNQFSVEEAEVLKRRFIREYRSTDPQYGYNATTGGRKEYSFTEEAKKRSSQTKTGKDGRTDWCAYIHTNKINGKKYIGVTCRDPKTRWANGNGYRRPANQGEAYGHFFHAIQKYGWENFDHEIVKTGLTHSEAAILEKELIAKFDTTNPEKGYNITIGGDGSTGASHSSETKEKLSRLGKERLKNPDNNPFKGKHHTDEAKEKLRLSHKGLYDGDKNPFAGKHHTGETKALLSEQRSEPVNQYSFQGEYIRQYPSGKEAAAAVGVSPTAIAEAVVGKTRFSAGYIWKKASEGPPIGEKIDATAILGDSKHTGQKKAVLQYDIDGNFIHRYSSLAEAAKAVGGTVSNISAAANGKNKTSKGFKWSFE